MLSQPAREAAKAAAGPEPEVKVAPRDPRISFEASAADLKNEPVVFFAKQFFSKIDTPELKREVELELDKMEKILAADPYMNGGRGQSGKKVITASIPEIIDLVDKYSKGELHGGNRIEALSEQGRIAFKSLVAWYIEYRNSFPDPTETGCLESNLQFLRQTLDNKMMWGICLTPDPVSGRVAAAFSGQVLEIPVTFEKDKVENIRFTWGEHLFVVPEFRRSRIGQQLLEGLEVQMEKQFGQTAFTLIEVDNPYSLLDANKVENSAYFDHSNPAMQEKLWTSADGPGLAMDPFARIRFWHKLGFTLLVVERKDLPEGNNSVAQPYNQVPLSKDGKPCETIILAVRIEDEKIRQAIMDGSLGVEDFKEMIIAMQATTSPDFRDDPSYKATMEEIQRTGTDSKVRLVSFCTENRKVLNPEALEILKRTAEHKLTAEKYKSSFAFADLNTTTNVADAISGRDGLVLAA